MLISALCVRGRDERRVKVGSRVVDIDRLRLSMWANKRKKKVSVNYGAYTKSVL